MNKYHTNIKQKKAIVSNTINAIKWAKVMNTNWKRYPFNISGTQWDKYLRLLMEERHELIYLIYVKYLAGSQFTEIELEQLEEFLKSL